MVSNGSKKKKPKKQSPKHLEDAMSAVILYAWFAKLTHVQDSFDAQEMKLSGCHKKYYGALHFG